MRCTLSTRFLSSPQPMKKEELEEQITMCSGTALRGQLKKYKWHTKLSSPGPAASGLPLPGAEPLTDDTAAVCAGLGGRCAPRQVVQLA